MALVLKDRVRETSTTTGTGTFTLSGAVTGFQSFSAIGTGNTTYYTIAMGSEWEVGVGTWTSPDQLSRDIILASTNGGAAVNFSSGTKDVFATFPAEGFAVAPPIGGTTPNTITGTTVTASTKVELPAVVNTGVTTGRIYMADGGDGYDYLSIDTWDGSSQLAVFLPGGLTASGVLFADAFQSSTYNIYDPISTNSVVISATSGTGSYTLTLPTSAGSNNQVLKTDGSGNLSWINLNAPSIYTTTSSQNSTSTTLANITGLTATLAANTTYRVDCFVTFQSAATTTGMNFGFTSPTGTVCMLEVVVPITSTAAASQLRTIFPNAAATNTGSVLGTGVTAINSNHTARFSGIVRVNATGGTFAAQYATEVNASAITIPAGSTMVIQQIS